MTITTKITSFQQDFTAEYLLTLLYALCKKLILSLFTDWCGSQILYQLFSIKEYTLHYSLNIIFAMCFPNKSRKLVNESMKNAKQTC